MQSDIFTHEHPMIASEPKIGTSCTHRLCLFHWTPKAMDNAANIKRKDLACSLGRRDMLTSVTQKERIDP